MSTLKQGFVRQKKMMFTLISVFVIGYALSEYKAMFLGLLLGSVLSYYNLWSMVRKIDRFSEAIVSGKKFRSLGTTYRFATAALIAIIAINKPDQVNLVGAVLGLMTAYVVIMIDYFIQLIVLRKEI